MYRAAVMPGGMTIKFVRWVVVIPAQTITPLKVRIGAIQTWSNLSPRRRQTRINEILCLQLLPFRKRIGNQFILMHDNARPHTAALTREFLRDHDITVLDPAMSPELESHRTRLGFNRSSVDCPRHPTTLVELERVLQEI